MVISYSSLSIWTNWNRKPVCCNTTCCRTTAWIFRFAMNDAFHYLHCFFFFYFLLVGLAHMLINIHLLHSHCIYVKQTLSICTFVNKINNGCSKYVNILAEMTVLCRLLLCYAGKRVCQLLKAVVIHTSIFWQWWQERTCQLLKAVVFSILWQWWHVCGKAESTSKAPQV